MLYSAVGLSVCGRSTLIRLITTATPPIAETNFLRTDDAWAHNSRYPGDQTFLDLSRIRHVPPTHMAWLRERANYRNLQSRHGEVPARRWASTWIQFVLHPIWS